MPWSALDPRARAFDLERVRPKLEAIVDREAASFRKQQAPRDRIAHELDTAIVKTYGTWAGGWRWSPSEPGGGGPTRGWCCARDSVFREDDRAVRDTAARALAALADWRQYLVELDLLFARIRIETAAFSLAREVEHAAAQVLVLVVQRTACEDAWYATFDLALCWYLQAAGLADDTIEELIETTIGGRFESWVEPDRDTARAVHGEIAAGVAARFGEGELRDALADWRCVREAPIALLPRAEPEPELLPANDAHARYIEEHDRARDPQRAVRMAAALELCRNSAAHGLALSFDQLAEWQGVVLGGSHPIPFRTTDAFGKRGRECYRFEPRLEVAFDRALADAGDPAIAVAVRAARAYLDVCFFHPFVDGNARAARLALDHVLSRAKLALRVAEPVFAVARGSEPEALWNLAVVIERCATLR